MIIDVHNHAYYHGYNCKKLVSNMDECGIDKTWLLTWETPESECNPEVSWCVSRQTPLAAVPLDATLEYIREAPERFTLGYAPDPRDPYAVNRLKAAVNSFDVKICGEVKLRMMYDNPDALRLFRCAGELGLPVLLHFDYEYPSGKLFPRPSWWYGGGIDCLERVLIACPGTNFIGHAPGFWAHISNDDKYLTEPYPSGELVPGGKIERLLEKYPNLYCDISANSGLRALSRDKEYTVSFLNRFRDRVLYGRDYYYNAHQELLNSLGLEKDVLDDIYYKNALRLIHEL